MLMEAEKYTDQRHFRADSNIFIKHRLPTLFSARSPNLNLPSHKRLTFRSFVIAKALPCRSDLESQNGGTLSVSCSWLATTITLHVVVCLNLAAPRPRTLTNGTNATQYDLY